MEPLTVYIIGMAVGFISALVLGAQVSKIEVHHMQVPDPKDFTPEFSEKLNDLVAEAKMGAESRGHKLGPWRVLEGHRTLASTCSTCGMEVVINTNPAPNEIDIEGPAVALTCDAGAHQP